MASGISAAKVSRIGLPFSHVSATANNSIFCSRRSAIFNNRLERSVGEAAFHLVLAAWAASSASSMSSGLDLATLAKGLPLTGEILSKYSPLTGATHWPPIKLSYFSLKLILAPSVLGSA